MKLHAAELSLMGLIVLVIIFVGVSYGIVHPVPSQRPTHLSFGVTSVHLLIADNEVTREHGLSDHAPLGENEGMLFIFEKLGYYPFWMKDMRFALDILWIDENCRVVHVEKGLTPETFPHVYPSDTLAKYVLEVDSGFTESHQIKVGDRCALH